MSSAELHVGSSAAEIAPHAPLSLHRFWLAVTASGLIFITATCVPALAQSGSYNFGSVNVGSNSTTTTTYTFSSSVTLASPSVTTQGATGLDFTIVATTCAGLQTSSCTVTIQFAPSLPGPRYGAIRILDSSGNLIFTTFVQGIGLAPVAAFAHAAQIAMTVTGLASPGGIAVDAAGDIFISDTANNQVVELPKGCNPASSGSCQITVATGLSNPQGSAVDGAGDLFVADTGNNRVLEIPTGCSGCQTTVGSGSFTPNAVAADGAGDIFIADSLNNKVFEVPAGCGPGQTSCQVTIATGLNGPRGVAVDGAGDVFVADSLNNQVLEAPAGCTASQGACLLTLAAGLGHPNGLAIDAAGDLFVGDTNNNRVLEIPAGCSSASCQASLGGGLSSPAGVSLDGTGNLFIADSGNGRVAEIQSSQPAALSFGSIQVGTASSTQVVTWQNIGNAPLTFSNIAASAGFTIDPGTSTCSASLSYSLAPGGTCNAGIECAPVAAGTLNGTLTLNDNVLNGSATQQVSLSCTGVGSSPAIISSNGATFAVGGSATFVVTASGAPIPSLSESGGLPVGLTFQDNGNGTATLGGTPAAGSGGTYAIIISAANGIIPTATQAFTLAVDQAPAITSGNSGIFSIGNSGSFTVATSGYPISSLAESGASLPTGVTFQDNGDGTATLAGLPAPGTGGIYNLTINAQNGVLPNATQSFTLNVPAGVSAAVSARFLEQSSWGPTAATIAQLQQADLPTFLQQQFSAPISTYPTPSSFSAVQQQFFLNAMNGQDQLRQRVSFALSEIMVISNFPKSQSPIAFSQWMNTLQSDAFGNFFQLLNDVTLSPGMGFYLNVAQNKGCNTCRPNENYARELLQLFTIGLDELNPDGTLVLDGNGNPIPTFTQATVTGLSQVFTGWTYPAMPGHVPSFSDAPYYSGPMIPFQAQHNSGAKVLLNDTTLAGGGNINSDLQSALQNIFYHPNVAPFICAQLIQKLVTSNPIPAYVSRCSNVFNDDGTGVRGNLQAVISEILLDQEARRGDDPAQVQPTDGHLREPLLFMIAAMRSVNTTTDGVNLTLSARNMGQAPFESPSVFNFYPPNYQVPGIEILGPEFKILNASSAVWRVNFIHTLLYTKMAPHTAINIGPYVAVAGNPSALLNLINANLMYGAMPSDMYNSILSTISNKKTFSTPTTTAEAALYLVLSSMQFQVEE